MPNLEANPAPFSASARDRGCLPEAERTKSGDAIIAFPGLEGLSGGDTAGRRRSARGPRYWEDPSSCAARVTMAGARNSFDSKCGEHFRPLLKEWNDAASREDVAPKSGQRVHDHGTRDGVRRFRQQRTEIF